MPLIIDGDNLLHATRAALEEAERVGRSWLCRLLADWDARTRQGVTIVFDGFRPDTPGDGPLGEGALLIRYSNRETADELIIEAIEASSAPRRLIVVSSDREVRMAARRRRAQSVDSLTFITHVLRDLRRAERRKNPEPREKFTGLEPGQADRWLREFGIDPDADEGEDDLWLM